MLNDNVLRKEAFAEQYPWWTIEYDKERRQFEAVNTREENFTITALDLGPLVDKLLEIEGALKR